MSSPDESAWAHHVAKGARFCDLAVESMHVLTVVWSECCADISGVTANSFTGVLAAKSACPASAPCTGMHGLLSPLLM